ncbi:hypothetical protein HA466_0250510 [Hirschfeldia incana]|nr:hypothetical protein HA466_0250510 [Hirschfeldia incana]KAJ0237143.1 hypothetical protein HA466_0250510 [Hirschfeldia incana]KAJ0237144.1 hypothetical protein HA466_0250510 [Hirschfeldia incana]
MRRRSGGWRRTCDESSEQRNEFSLESEMSRWFQRLEPRRVRSRRGRWRFVNVSTLAGGGGLRSERLPELDV